MRLIPFALEDTWSKVVAIRCLLIRVVMRVVSSFNTDCYFPQTCTAIAAVRSLRVDLLAPKRDFGQALTVLGQRQKRDQGQKT